MDVDRSGATGIANVKPNRRLVRVILLILFILDFGSYALFLYNSSFNPNGTVIFHDKKEELKNIYWPPFLREYAVCKKHDYPFVDNIMNYYVAIKPVWGLAADYFAQKLLRISALLYFSAVMAAIITFIVIEALIRRKEKILNFQNISSTRYHLSLRAGIGTSIAFVLFYIFLPTGEIFGFRLPEKIGNIYLNDPALWIGLTTVCVSFALFVVISNLPRDI